MITPRLPNGRISTLLIVDDDDVDAMALERALQRMGIANPVRRARDGQEALELLHARLVPEPWIVLLDLNMPRMGGLEFLKVVRADPALTGTVIFVLTTSKADEDMAAAYRDHIAGYILKQSIADDEQSFGEMVKRYRHLVELPMVGSAGLP
jgi:CheY-like chemotaxis protein